MSEFQVIIVDKEAQALDFLEEHGGVFHRRTMMAHCQSIVRLGIINKQGDLIGGLNLEQIKLKGFAALAAPTWHPHCALFTLPFEGNHTRVFSQQKKVLEAIATFLSVRKEKVFSIPFPPEWTDMQPLMWAGFNCTPKYTYRIDLQKHPDLLDVYAPKVRTNVRKCSNELLIIEPGTFDEFYSCLHQTALNAGFDLNVTRLKSFADAAANDGLEMTVAKHNGRAMAASMTVSDAVGSYYLFGGMDRTNSDYNALTCILHASIEQAQQRGLNYFDFEGSMIPGVEAYFRSFGGNQLPYFLVSKAPVWMLPFLRWRGRTEF